MSHRINITSNNKYNKSQSNLYNTDRILLILNPCPCAVASRQWLFSHKRSQHFVDDHGRYIPTPVCDSLLSVWVLMKAEKHKFV